MKACHMVNGLDLFGMAQEQETKGRKMPLYKLSKNETGSSGNTVNPWYKHKPDDYFVWFYERN